MQQQAIIVGSLASVAKANNQSLAESFISADCVVLVDTSSSMSCADFDIENRKSKSRYDRACDELSKLQSNLPGKIAVISFASEAVFCPAGIPQPPHGTTDLAGALRFAKVADVGGMRFIVISDGEPDNEREALDMVAQYSGRVDVIYVGPQGGPGESFLKRLAKSKGGQSITAANAKELAAAAQFLLTSKAP